jgi:hypothetical protein
MFKKVKHSGLPSSQLIKEKGRKDKEEVCYGDPDCASRVNVPPVMSSSTTP